MADTYVLTMTGDDLKALLDILTDSNVSGTELSYVAGVTSNIQTQLNTLSSSLSSHTHPASRVTAGTFAGKVVGNASAEATLTDGQFRNITISTAEPTRSDGGNGDVWIVYES